MELVLESNLNKGQRCVEEEVQDHPVYVLLRCFSGVQPYGLNSARLLCAGDSLGKNTGVDCHALLQGIFLTQGSNPRLLRLPSLAGGYFTTTTTWKASLCIETDKYPAIDGGQVKQRMCAPLKTNKQTEKNCLCSVKKIR